MSHDLLLSSGFLAFARHCGFLDAVEELGVSVGAVYGTSSGALCGSLWSAGMTASQVADVVSRDRPIASLGWSWRPWRGLFTLAPLVRRLEELLPPAFEALPRSFGVGVACADGSQTFLTGGPLAHAVAASCAMPFVFAPVDVGGVTYRDGGAVDRLGLSTYRAQRGNRRVLIHQIERTAGRDVANSLGNTPVVYSGRSRANFWSLGDFAGQRAEAHRAALAQLRVQLGEGG